MRWYGFFSILFTFVLSVCIFFPVQQVHAWELVDKEIRLTRQEVATSTDMEVGFTGISGIHGPTDNVTISFPEQFDITGIDHSDIALSFGPTTGYEFSGTVAAGPDAGVWGFQRIGQTIWLFPPLDAGVNAVPSGDRMRIRIGSWAGGSHQIITPTDPGIYAVRISGGFGDDGRGFVRIYSQDGLGVTVTVTPGSGAGSGGAPVVGGGKEESPSEFDGTPPDITGLGVANTTDVSTIISWITDEPSDAQLEYGRSDDAYWLGTLTRADRRTKHEFFVEGLQPGTKYTARVRARDAMGNTSISQYFSFITLTTPTDLIISGIDVSFVDDHQAVIRWRTTADVISGVIVETASGPRTILGTSPARSHVVTVTDLSPSTHYPFQIVAESLDGTSLTAPGPGFTTLRDRTSPSNVRNFRGVFNEGSRMVELTWVNPDDPGFTKTEITRISSDAVGSGIFVCITPQTRCVDTPPLGESSVFYRAVAFDAMGNPSTGALVQVLLTSSAELPSLERVAPTSDEKRETPRSAAAEVPELEDSALPAVIRPSDSDVGSVISTGRDLEERVMNTSASSSPFTHEPTRVQLPVGLDAGSRTGSSESADSPPFLGQEALQLTPYFFLSPSLPAVSDRAGVRSVLVNRSIQVHIPVTEVQTSLRQAQLQTSEGSLYQFSYREHLGAFISDFSFDGTHGARQFVHIQAVAADGRRWEGRFPIHIRRPAQVTDVSNQSRVSAVEGAVIEVLSSASRQVIARITTDAGGRYAHFIKNGRYVLRVTKEGYRTQEQSILIEDGILAVDLKLKRNLRPIREIIHRDAPLIENVSAFTSEAVLAAGIGLEIVRRSEVQAVAQEVVAPVVVVATVGTTATAVSGFALLNYLRFLFTQPLLLIKRRKRKSWGVVYNALSKQPVELAIVRLLKAGTNFAIQTRITDAQGRFSFFVPAGSYTIQVQKPGYHYPTTYLKGERMDVDYIDLYHGEELHVTQASTISPNIPLDPVLKEETPKSINRKRLWRKIQSILGVAGIVISLAAVVVSPTVPMIGFALFQILSYAIVRRIALPPSPKRWGIVYDTDGKQPLAKVIVRIFDKKFNKLLETQITSKDGTYGFFVAKGRYYLTAEKPGYERYLSQDIDLTHAKDTYVDHRFTLKQATSTSSVIHKI